ncbi:hypothetical protein EVAR_80131_1 [Eumeta japonica]|uniref:Uncharacterized protein n=1 Tax=Eumeta variegata TaxID=151549 RepID=A0A4C1SY78_EUMVA|nr:hypothetical protein EVAR_80131_1 [Eumeta japonica]
MSKPPYLSISSFPLNQFPTQKAGNALVTALKSRISMDGGDHLYSGDLRAAHNRAVAEGRVVPATSIPAAAKCRETACALMEAAIHV